MSDDDQIPTDIMGRGGRMLAHLTAQSKTHHAAGVDEEFMALGIYLHAMRDDNPPDMVALMFAAAVVALGRPDGERELRRKLWELAKEWELTGMQVMEGPYMRCATDLRKALTYPAATAADEEQLQRTFGKSSDELADEAERGYEIDGSGAHDDSEGPPIQYTGLDRSFDERGMGL